MQERHLNNPPIVEAVFEFRIDIPSSFDLDKLSQIHEKIKDRFPTIEKKIESKLSTIMKEEKKPEASYSEDFIGFSVLNIDKTKILQFKRNGFSYHKLTPYTSWHDLFPEAMEMWALYIELVNVSIITRIGVRFINRILLPLKDKSLNDFITIPLPVPPMAEAFFENFLTNIKLHDVEKDVTFTIAQSVDNPSVSLDMPYILDIDVFKEGSFPTQVEPLRIQFELLREMKNKIFFDTLTEEAGKLCD